MRAYLKVGALAASLLAPISGIANSSAAEPETIATKVAPTLETQVRAQQTRIEEQDAKIEQLEQQLHDVSAILSTRVDRVEAQTDAGKVVATSPGPRIEGPNARHSMTFIGAVQTTVGSVEETVSGPAAPHLHGGWEIRRARIGVQGVAFDNFAYQAEIDLSATGGVASAAKDLYVQYNGFRPFSFTFGNVKPQTGLEASFSDRSNAQTFAESSMLTSMYTTTGARDIGLRASTGGANWSATLGYYGDDVNNNGVATPGKRGSGFHGRLTYAPIVTPTTLLHFGVSGFDRTVALDSTGLSQLRVRAQPESTLDAGRLIDTGNLPNAKDVQLVALETAGLVGPIGFQGEWGQMNVSRIGGRPDLTFEGAYVGANWFLTGESRVYDPRTGVFTRFTPRVMMDPASHTWGAWEVAARWSNLDLNSDPNLLAAPTALLGVRGGNETNYTFGVNWYWNAYFRMMLNYVHAEAKNRTNSLPGIGADEGATADLVGLRVQQEW